MKKVSEIFINSIPVLIMVGLIPLVLNDYVLTALYIGIIFIARLIKRNRNDLTALVVGFMVTIVFEYLFVRTEVEILDN